MSTLAIWGLYVLACIAIFGGAYPFLMREQRKHQEPATTPVPWNGARMSQFYAVHHRHHDQIDFGPFDTIKEFEDWYEEVGRQIGFSGGLRHLNNPWQTEPRDAWWVDREIPVNELFGRDVISGSDSDSNLPKRVIRWCEDCRDRLPRDYDASKNLCERCDARMRLWYGDSYYDEWYAEENANNNDDKE